MNTRFAVIMLALLIGGYLAGQSSPQIKKTPVQKTSPASGLESAGLGASGMLGPLRGLATAPRRQP